jgi:hypothetical protein
MEVRMESKKGQVVTGIDPVLAEIQQRLQADPKEWLQSLERNPGDLANLSLLNNPVETGLYENRS